MFIIIILKNIIINIIIIPGLNLTPKPRWAKAGSDAKPWLTKTQTWMQRGIH